MSSRKPQHQRQRNPRPAALTEIIQERIEILLDLAQREAKEKPERSRRYLQLVRKLCLRYNVRLTREQKMRFCKRCFTFWRPGANVKVRLEKKGKRICYFCSCGAVYKVPLAARGAKQAAGEVLFPKQGAGKGTRFPSEAPPAPPRKAG